MAQSDITPFEAPSPTFPSNKTAYIFRDDGTIIRFDTVTQETHTLVNDITEHPVESGANITDHVRSQVDTISLEVFVSNTPITNVDKFQFGSIIGNVSPLGLDAPGDTRLGGLAAQVLQFDNTDGVNFVSEIFRALREIKENAELVTVVTPAWDYSSMVIKEVGMPRTAAEGNGAKIKVDFKQIRLVQTKLVEAPVATEPRAKKSVDKGAKGANGTNDDDASKKKSLLASAVDKLGSLF